MRLSVAIPLHNEGQVLPELLDRLRAVLDALSGGPHEMIFVDDGSRDTTLELLQAAALAAALDQVSGDAVVVMDGDLQDAPEDIPRLLARLEEGFDVVYAQRVRRKERLVLRVAYFVFYRLIASLSKLKLPVDAGDFGIMSRRVVDEIRRAPEHNRYLRGLRTWVGFRQTGLELERAERFAGQSKYSVRALVRLAFDGIFAFSIAPLRAAAVLGAFAVLVATLFALYAIYARVVLNQSPQGFTSLIVVMTFLSGMNLFFLGVIGEYVGRVYEESKARPLYVIDKLIREGHDRRTGRERRTGPAS